MNAGTPARNGQPRVVVILPTYDERNNIESITAAILHALPSAALWVVDDNSPDGTGDLADKLAAREPRMRVHHRPAKQGLGTAYAESFARALAEGFDFAVEMDADFSHDPLVLPHLVRAAHDADLVIGSRYVPGGSTPGWSLPRRIISRIGNLVARLVLGLPVHDATAGYRVFNRRALDELDLEGVMLQGYGFQIETVYQCFRAGLRIVEYPIAFVDRRAGQSKMSRAIVAEALVYVFRRRFQDSLQSLRSVSKPYRVRDNHQPAESAHDGQQHVEPAAPRHTHAPVDELERAETRQAEQGQ